MEVACPFCKNLHRSEFADELEEAVLACRDSAPPEKRGLVEYLVEEPVRTVEQVLEWDACLPGGP